MASSKRQHLPHLARPMFALLISCAFAFAAEAQKAEPIYIGNATMAADGTITMNLRRTADGMSVSGVIKYPVGDPRYQEVLSHIGGLRPGETKLVPAWGDDKH
jgi:hypothetical protein